MSTPELLFQQHVADFLEREHGYERLGKDAAIDPTDVWMADVLWAFVVDTQPQAVETLRGSTVRRRGTSSSAPCGTNCGTRPCG